MKKYSYFYLKIHMKENYKKKTEYFYFNAFHGFSALRSRVLAIYAIRVF